MGDIERARATIRATTLRLRRRAGLPEKRERPQTTSSLLLALFRRWAPLVDYGLRIRYRDDYGGANGPFYDGADR